MVTAYTKYLAKSFSMHKNFPFHLSRYVHDYETGIILPMHSHEFIEIVSVISGSATHLFQSDQFGELSYKIYAGDIFIINPDEQHTYHLEPYEKIEIVNLQFYPQVVDWSLLRGQNSTGLMDLFYVQPFLGHQVRFSSKLKLDAIGVEEIRLLICKIEMEFTEKQLGFDSLISVMLAELIIRLSRYYSKRSEPENSHHDSSARNLQRVLGYLERHYDENINIKELAEIANCGERQLSRIFKQATDMTVIHYLHWIRVEKAKKLLLGTNDKILSISNEVGFKDVAFFNRIFKRMTGSSPTQYRNIKDDTSISIAQT